MKHMQERHVFWFMALLLWLFWIAVTASYHYQGILLGAVLALLLARFNQDLFFKREERPLLDGRTLLLFLRYGLHLLGAIIIACLQVAYLALHPAMPISPGMIRYPLTLKKDLNRVLLANSITLTPGTLTVLMEEEEIVVHALTEKNAREVVQWSLAAELAAIDKAQE
ncbi:MAG: Na+/H+ antiporter subunit E [Bacillota bacterium]